MFVDIHSHALPGVDDGSKQWKMTLEMFKQAVEQDITHMVLTPHYIEGDRDYCLDTVMSAYERSKQLIQEQGLDLNVSLGNEVFIDEKNVTRLKNKECMTLNGTSYVLLELPAHISTSALEGLIYDLQLEGYQPVFAHVERYDWLYRRPILFKELLNHGVLMQINATSVLSSDWRMRRRVKHLIQEGMVHIVASDAHDDVKRRFRLKEAYEKVGRKYGWKLANCLFIENPLRVIRDKYVGVPEKAQEGIWWRR
ncbi:hypothetical protein JR334_07025 [Clostridia bacterium]|nr:hypothetical protein JR334_07025 [Clostridia bacterium]